MELLFKFLVVVWLQLCITGARSNGEEDWLLPYKYHHGPTHSNRYVRDCQPLEHGNVTHETYPAHSDLTYSGPVVEIQNFAETIGYYWEQKLAIGHKFVINNPARTVSVVEPGGDGGCKNESRRTVLETAEKKQCLFAVNAGFFNVTSDGCLGDVVSDGRDVQSSNGVQNAHFGIKEDGSLFFGYLTDEDRTKEHFRQLVGGVIWLVREGKNYVETSKLAECSDLETTGTMETFVDVTSARMAVGHNAKGQLVILQVDGETDIRGINLNELADLMISMGVINAINLDGGGSVSAVLNGQMLNYPSDKCEPNNGTVEYRCVRETSTVLCVHEMRCEDDCHHHGDCIQGSCRCHDNWVGPSCELLYCGVSNCSRHGICTEASGCECWPGWVGEECEEPCPEGSYGKNCWGTCHCANGGVCDPQDGSCECPVGYTGVLCDKKCPHGRYGLYCRQLCYCDKACTCHHVTGACNVSIAHSEVLQVGQCLANNMIQDQHLVVDQPEQYRLYLISLITLSIIAAGSIILNISLVSVMILSRSPLGWKNTSHPAKQVYRPPRIAESDSSCCSADDEFQTDSSLDGIPLDVFKTRQEPQLKNTSKNTAFS